MTFEPNAAEVCQEAHHGGPPPAPVVAAGRKLPPLITAKAALNLLAPLVGGPSAAKDLIIDQVYQGAVRAFALHQWEAHHPDIKAVWRAGPPADATKKARISRTLLRPSRRFNGDSQAWNWLSGRFYVTIGTHPIARRMLHRVRFDRDDIQKLVKAYAGKVGRGGRPPKEDAWAKVWMQLIRMASAGELTKARQVTRDAFRRTVFQALKWDKEAKPPLAELTIGKATGLVWDELIEPKL